MAVWYFWWGGEDLAAAGFSDTQIFKNW